MPSSVRPVCQHRSPSAPGADDVHTLNHDTWASFIVELDRGMPRRLELEYGRTALATGDDARWIRRRFRHACATLGERVAEADRRLVLTWFGASGAVVLVVTWLSMNGSTSCAPR
jgi:hypothetical protein